MSFYNFKPLDRTGYFLSACSFGVYAFGYFVAGEWASDAYKTGRFTYQTASNFQGFSIQAMLMCLMLAGVLVGKAGFRKTKSGWEESQEPKILYIIQGVMLVLLFFMLKLTL